jgi:exodeoxyribonuclease V alpha subunit
MLGMPETLSGTIENVTFHNPDNGFAVLRVQARGRRGPITVVGHLPSAIAGELVVADGDWVQDRDHGLQFRAQQLRAFPPHTPEGIARYLGSGLVKGIGPHFARKIVAVFGERTLAVIDESPAFLREVKGIGSRRIQRIRESWQEQKAVRNIMMFLQEHGVTTSKAVRIYKTYGEQAVELVRANPYRLAGDVWGFGFKTADALARRLGIDQDSPLRARAALGYVLQQLANEGNVGYPESRVIDHAADPEKIGIDPDVLRAAVEHERTEGSIVRDTPGGENDDGPWLYLKPMFLAEVGVARALKKLREGGHPLPAINAEVALSWAERKMGIELAPSQRDAIQQAITQKTLVITGGPGVGKTTIVRGILEIFAAKGLSCGLCAPTGRAAKRLCETTGREARTIHRLLEYDPGFSGFKHDRDRPLDYDLIVVDEASMVDVVLMNQLLRAVSPTACVVLVGDVDQLPSVGAGTVLADVIRSQAVPVVRLTHIFRQAGQSHIVRAAHRVNEGQLPESSPTAEGDFFFIEVDESETVLDRLITLVRDRIPARFGLDSFRDIQVLTPMNRHDLGSMNLNARLQEALNPSAGKAEVQRHGWTFRVGDKVLQTVNNYKKEVFNGDIGRVTDVDLAEQELTVEFDRRLVPYDFGDLDELALAYAMTVHRSQGSEYPAVVVPLHTQHFLMLQRNLLYTGITRGKKVVVLVGSRRALTTAVQRQDTARRHSALAWRLRQCEDEETKNER